MAVTMQSGGYAFMPSSFPSQVMFTPIPSSPSANAVWPLPPLPPVPITPRSVFNENYFTPAAQSFGGGELCAKLEAREREILAADANQNAVWPEPPLPPVSSEINSRIASLGEHLGMSVELVRQKEAELEAAQSEWQAKVMMLESKIRDQEATGARRVEEAMRNTEFRIRDEMRGEVQTLLRNFEEENERLSAKLEEAERLKNEFRVERDTARRVAQQQTTKLELRNEELEKQLEAMTKERNAQAHNYNQIKKANSQREQESLSLRTLIEEERQRMKLLQSERDKLRSERDTALADLAYYARDRLHTDRVSIERSPHISPRISATPRASAERNPGVQFQVDITEDSSYAGLPSFIRTS